MERVYINRQITNDLFIDLAFERYLQLKQTANYVEGYKYDILSELNLFMQSKEITSDTIHEIFKKLLSSNPIEDSFVDWRYLDRLHHYINEAPNEVALLLNDLYYNDSLSLNERIENFRKQIKNFNPDWDLDAALFGYLLASFDYKKYPIYHVDIYKHIKNLFALKIKLGSSGDNYENFYTICFFTKEYLHSKGYEVNMLDVQDLFYLLTYHEKIKVESAVDFVFHIANELHGYKQDTEGFIAEICKQDRKFLEKMRKTYENEEKVKKIRYEILNYILNHHTITVDEIERIKERVSQNYDTNILQSWKNFTILFPLYYGTVSEKVDFCLQIIHETIRTLDGLEQIALEEKQVIKNFYRKQNFGDSNCWLAVYPAFHKNHRTSVQLYFGVVEGEIRYGLYYGTEHPNRTKDYLTSIHHANEFSYEAMVEYFTRIIPHFIEEAKKSKTNPILNIFANEAEANWAFDFVQQSIAQLGITEPGDVRISVTYRKDKKIHISFAGWLIIGFEKNGNERTMIKLALLYNEKLEQWILDKDIFHTEADEPTVISSALFLEDLQENEYLQQIFTETLKFVKEKFRRYNRTPFRKHTHLQLEKAIFNQEVRKEVFTKGIMQKGEIDDNLPSSETKLATFTTTVEIPTVSFEQHMDLDNLYFPEKDILLRQIETALKGGKHIILTGPPGTGKSKLAKEICRVYEVDYKMVTATSDWSTYETIGGYKPNKDRTLSFQPGIFLDCFKNRTTHFPINKWLIIDEMNRADIDKAFGSLFSALTGDEITLHFLAESGNNIVIKSQEDVNIQVNDYEYVIPRDWRLIGTMNTFDKASLYEMSYAFMRRFAFIPVDVPANIDTSLVEIYLDIWNIADYKYTQQLAFLWQHINYYRSIGPAIIEELVNFTADNGDFTSALILYVLPQFEGLMDQQIGEFIDRVSHLSLIDEKRLKQFCRNFFQVKV